MVGNKVNILSWKHMRKLGGKRAIKWAEVNNSIRTDSIPQQLHIQAVCMISSMGRVTLQTAVPRGDAASDTSAHPENPEFQQELSGQAVRAGLDLYLL